MPDTNYPPSPARLPEGLTALSSSYQLRAALAVAAIILFFLLFTALVVGTAWLVWIAVVYPMGSINKITILAKLGAIAGSLMLFVFTLKFAFKLKNHVPANRVEIKREKHPRLFAFIERICTETSAPRPRKIHADPDVNAYVAYTNTWLSLLLPVKKDLTIGLGLVSILDRSEFKAVMAHEFGHFAQRSMRIGSYIVSANTIIHDMIYNRDKWDDMLDEWRGADIRLSFAAWIITPIIWLIRKTLGLFYILLNRLHSSLSREMEFNADKVAVSTSGSEAIISALWKMDEGERHWNATMNSAYMAAQKNMFVKDLYRHNDLAIGRSAEGLREQFAALPADDRGGRRHFTTSEHSKVGMYASHPPNDMREASAKRPFVPCEHDTAPAWSLFDDVAGLRESMTSLIYSGYLSKKPQAWIEEAEFEAFVRAEQAGAELLAEHHGTYNDRFLTIPEQEDLRLATAALKGAKRATTREMKESLASLMAPVKEIEQLMRKAQQISEGTTKEAGFAFNGKQYGKNSLQAGWDELAKARDEHFNGPLKEWDKAYCAAHLLLAEEQGKSQDLERRYAQHRALNAIFQRLVGARNFAVTEVQRLQGMGEVSKEIVRGVVQDINARVADANKQIKALANGHLVPLPNIASTSELQEAIMPGGQIREGSVVMFENGDFGRLMNDLDRAIAHCQRVDSKSIIGVLQAHKELLSEEAGTVPV